ncbi:fdhC protein [Cladochytrium replicatum]|nr:fdhC protein [Cladochytrium replicatum]
MASAYTAIAVPTQPEITVPRSQRSQRSSTTEHDHPTHDSSSGTLHAHCDPHIKLITTPPETTHTIDEYSIKKSHTQWYRVALQSFLAGVMLSFGGAFALALAGGAPSIGASDPGLQKLLYGLAFPVGLCMIVITGAELFTSNVMYMTVGALSRHIKITHLLLNWLISYLGNFAGSAFTAALFFYAGNTPLVAKDPWRAYLIHFATSKVADPTWAQLLVRGIGCNWLVCLAVYMALSAQDIFGKCAAIYLPIVTFTTLGFEHCIANQFSIVLALMVDPTAVGFDFGFFLWKNLLPVTLGNIIGGGFFVGSAYYYIYGVNTK